MNRMSLNGTAPSPKPKRKTTPAKPRKQNKGNKPLAYSVGAVGAFVLFLSVWECTAALKTLTGMPVVLAALLAVGIDLGMVVCEAAAVGSACDSEAHKWSERYIWLAVGLSVVLNAAAAGSHANGWWVLAAVPVGGIVPVFVYIAGRVSGCLYTGK